MSGCKRSTLILLTTGFLCLAATVSLTKEDKQTRRPLRILCAAPVAPPPSATPLQPSGGLTGTATNKPVSFFVTRPAGFKQQANCQGEMANAGIWLSKTKVFRLVIVPGLAEVMAQDLPKSAKSK
jgi:hypothetical protein